MRASLAADITPEHAAELIQQPDWMLQEKADGMRILMGTDPAGAVTLVNRWGKVTTVPKGTRLPTLPPSSWVDFEFLTKQRFWVGLDLLAWDGCGTTPWPAEARFRLLTASVPSMGADAGLIRCAVTLQDKLDLITTLKAERAEGVILKHRTRPYLPGEILSGGPIYKYPWRKRLDAIAFRAPDTTPDPTKSFTLYAYGDDGALVYIGRVNAQHHWQAIAPGQFRVVEIQYLHASADRKLVQPTIIGYRDDKPAEACLDTQLQIGGRHAAAAR
jgi:ATP-dependent DNA ligase